MSYLRNKAICNAAFVFMAVMLAGGMLSATAQTFPTKPVRLVIPFSAGSGTDLLFRSMVDRMSATLGQPVIAEYKPGGGTVIGAQYTKSQPADGYTAFLGSNTIAVNSAVPDAKIDIRKDFDPVVIITSAPLIIAVNAEQIKARSLKELVDYARSRPGELNFASYGVGSLAHLSMEVLLARTDTKMVHIPFPGSAQAATETAAGRTQITVGILTSLKPFISDGGSGKLRLLGVTTGEGSKIGLPLPGMKEMGFPDIDFRGWSGYFVAKGTPKVAIDRLNAAASEGLKGPATIEMFNRQGISAGGGTPADLANIINYEVPAYEKVIRSANLKLE